MWVSVCSPGPGPEPGKEAHPAGAVWGPSPTPAATPSPLPDARPEGGPGTRGSHDLQSPACALPAVTPWGTRPGWLVTKGSTPLSLAHFAPQASPGWADLEGPSSIARKPGAFAPQGVCTLSCLGT
uniref:Uncharacterized protein n=1 Tax=Myotis myotis TaxID=51298 RepID=A0A7J8AM22_MYOMY|nr:hypothetical protein mMyoMyo1_007791 [Myotis myotis]